MQNGNSTDFTLQEKLKLKLKLTSLHFSLKMLTLHRIPWYANWCSHSTEWPTNIPSRRIVQCVRAQGYAPTWKQEVKNRILEWNYSFFVALQSWATNKLLSVCNTSMLLTLMKRVYSGLQSKLDFYPSGKHSSSPPGIVFQQLHANLPPARAVSRPESPARNSLTKVAFQWNWSKYKKQ